MKKITSLTSVFILLSIAATAQTWDIGAPYQYPNVKATFSEGTLTIHGEGAMQSFDADDTAWHTPWTSIKENITSIVVEEGITEIGDYSFSNCVNLTGSLPLHEGITYIGIEAFRNCSNLSGPLTIPQKVKKIIWGAFQNCSGLSGSLIIPENVTMIEPYAFAGCKGLDGSLTLPEGITTIEQCVFEGCSGLTGTLTIPQGVTAIGRYAFCSCRGLTGSLIIPQGVKTIGNYAFSDCSSFTGSLIIPQGVTMIGMYAFADCIGLSSITIPQSLVLIEYEAFGYCTGITSVTNYAISPQNIDRGVFSGLKLSNIRLHVPASSLELYREAPVWKEFFIEGFFTSMDKVSTGSAAVVAYYSMLGVKLPQAPQSGVYIVVYDNGKAEKVRTVISK